MKTIHTQVSTIVYSQVLIDTAGLTGSMQSEESFPGGSLCWVKLHSGGVDNYKLHLNMFLMFSMFNCFSNYVVHLS